MHATAEPWHAEGQPLTTGVLGLMCCRTKEAINDRFGVTCTKLDTEVLASGPRTKSAALSLGSNSCVKQCEVTVYATV